MIVRADQEIQVGQEIEMMLCWFNDKQDLIPRGKYALKHTTADARCIIQSIDYKVNINTLEKVTEDKKVKLNDIAKVTVKTTKPLFYDSYERNRITGSVVLIEEGTNNTVAAGMIL
jgi:sulfate adenylyltransferase subunit 1